MIVVEDKERFPLVKPLMPYRYINLPDYRKHIEVGRYLVVRKDGKIHIERFNGSGWAYNNNEICYFYLPKIN